MKIFIKSFNRPYYLDRCLKSIYDNVIGEKLEIIVLDDGTDQVYLNKLEEKYPNVEFKLSNFYKEKVEELKDLALGFEMKKPFKIPSEFWLKNILSNTDQFFMILEDDMWIKNKLNLSECRNIMEQKNMCILKMFHCNNPAMFCGEKIDVNDEIFIVKPKLFTRNYFLFKMIYTRNFFKINVINGFLKIFSHKNKIDYYTIYNVAGAIFSKDYYNYLWTGFKGTVDEDQQLLKALSYHNVNKEKTYGVYLNDIIGTSFTSSATNMFKNIELNIFTYNQILNNAWVKNKFNPMKGFPLDIDSKEIERVLKNENNDKATIESWNQWTSTFKKQYRNVGHIIE